jgi:hypothetical protein
VLNLFNQETALERDSRKYLDGRIRTLDGTQVPGDLASFTDAMLIGTTQPNPNFGQPGSAFGSSTIYAEPRRLLATVRVDF